jgi:hypothetical protein
MDYAFLSAPASRFEEELGYEHLDHIVCHSVDRLDQRIHCVPRGWWIDPLAADIRGHLAGLAFRDGPARGLNRRPNLKLTSAFIRFRLLSRAVGLERTVCREQISEVAS